MKKFWRGIWRLTNDVGFDVDRVGSEFVILSLMGVITGFLPIGRIVTRGIVTIIVILFFFVVERRGIFARFRKIMKSVYKRVSWNGESSNRALRVVLASVIQLPICVLSVIVLCTIPWGLAWTVISVIAVELFLEEDENNYSGCGDDPERKFRT